LKCVEHLPEDARLLEGNGHATIGRLEMSWGATIFDNSVRISDYVIS
jgi:hypothetical protein